MKSTSVQSVASLTFAALAGLLPFWLFGLSIGTVSWLLAAQVAVAALVQFAIFHSQDGALLVSASSAVGGWLVGTLAWHAVFFLFGAALVEDAAYTLAMAALASSLTAVPLSKLTGYKVYDSLSLLSRDHLGAFDLLVAYQCAGVIAGVYASAVVIPLDWDRQWQKWPCPCVIGAWLGCCLGNAVYLTFASASKSLIGRKTA